MSALILASEGAENLTDNLGILPVILALPLVGALLIGVTAKARPDLIRTIAIATSAGVAAAAGYALYVFDEHSPAVQFYKKWEWIRSLDIKFALGVDGISLMLVVLTGVLCFLAICGAKPDHDEKPFYIWLLVLEFACLGAFMARDVFLFFVMFELSIVPLYMLIGGWGHGRRVYAANKFFLYTLLASVLMLVAMVVLVVNAKAGVNGGITFDLERLANHSTGISTAMGRWLFAGFAIAFAVKTPLFPFHTWLPDAHTEAPTAGSIDLAAVVLKLGTYGLLRYCVYLFPEAATFWAPTMLTLAVIGIIYGAAVAAMQKNFKRIVAYSSVSHMGFAVLGLFALNTIGIEGSVLVMINHGIATGALFLLLGWLYQRRHTYEISELSGLQKVAPWFAGAFTVVMLASIGVPGLNGFVGEFLSLLGAFLSNRWWAIVAASGVIIAALYLLWAYQRVFHGPTSEANKDFPELTWGERACILPLIALIVFLGVYPGPLLERIEPSVKALVAHVAEHNPGWHEDRPERPTGGEVATDHDAGGAAHTEGER
jgi:NADH-quinone oxidoreductase subunit M